MKNQYLDNPWNPNSSISVIRQEIERLLFGESEIRKLLGHHEESIRLEEFGNDLMKMLVEMESESEIRRRLEAFISGCNY